MAGGYLGSQRVVRLDLSPSEIHTEDHRAGVAPCRDCGAAHWRGTDAMKATTGYYSIIQYCPDQARHEVANVGVVLFCPELPFLKTRMAADTHRIKEVFPGRKPDEKRLKTTLP